MTGRFGRLERLYVKEALLINSRLNKKKHLLSGLQSGMKRF